MMKWLKDLINWLNETYGAEPINIEWKKDPADNSLATVVINPTKEKPMSKFSKRSAAKLATCDPQLQKLFERVLQIHDCTIVEGRRDKETQNEYFRTGKSKLKWPNSKHNCTAPVLSKAVDVAPYKDGGIPWDDVESFRYFAGIVIGVAAMMDIKIRWGGDWDGDNSFKDQTFHDLPHFELDTLNWMNNDRVDKR